MDESAAIAFVAVSIAGCVVGTNYADALKAEAKAKMTPQQLCVQNALTQNDRMECLNAQAVPGIGKGAPRGRRA